MDWHQLTEDHTVGDTNGKILVVQADQVAGEFYRTTVSGLCETTTYEFSAWVINLVIAKSFCSNQPGGTIPINVRFEIWDSTDTNRLAFGDTGNIVETSSPNWKEFALVFQTLSGQDEVILKMINNGQGGCGNDLAIDDIEFKSCGDTVEIVDSNNNTTVSLCSSQTPFSAILTATPDGVVYSSHFYQWQQSIDLGVTWTDILGEINKTLFTSVSNTTYYRAKIAEVAINLSNSRCVSFSNEYQLGVTQLPVMPTLACWETATINNANCSWDLAGIQPAQPPVVNCWNNWVFNTTTCIWDNTGTQPAQPPVVNCWDNWIFNPTTCIWDNAGTQHDTIFTEEVVYCNGETLILNSNTSLSNPIYLWSTRESTEFIAVNAPGTYSVEISSSACFFETKIFSVNQAPIPTIDDVSSEGSNIIVLTSNTGDFLYSLEGNIFQPNNIFYNVEGGLYTIYVKQRDCNNIVTSQYLHFYIPKFFTPNNDGVHDTFSLSGIEYFQSSQVFIFDRYGKLLKNSRNGAFEWDGTFNNKPLPTADYWYVIIINNQKFNGHFTLKR